MYMYIRYGAIKRVQIKPKKVTKIILSEDSLSTMGITVMNINFKDFYQVCVVELCA